MLNLKLSKTEELYIIKKSRILMLDHSLTEHDICKQLYICETSFRNIYNKYFGLPPKQYMLNVQMGKAKTLLRITDLHITEIAEKLNYASASKFSIIFKKHYGIAPHEYRNSLV